MKLTWWQRNFSKTMKPVIQVHSVSLTIWTMTVKAVVVEVAVAVAVQVVVVQMVVQRTLRKDTSHRAVDSAERQRETNEKI